jgi:penicillin-binding protein 2
MNAAMKDGAEVRDPAVELQRLRWRLLIAMLVVLALFGVLAARFGYLQVHRHADLQIRAEGNRIAVVPVPPARGLIYDRNGVLMAENVLAYTLELAPKQIRDLDATIEELATLVDISAGDRRRFRRLWEETKNSDWLPLKSRLSDEEVARIAVNRFRFPGVDVRARHFRTYPLGQTASHAIGYIGRISPEDKRRLEDAGKASDYAGSTHIGKVGVEQSYEQVLHGHTGFEEVEVTAAGRGMRTLSRNPASPGRNLVLSIDARLQKLAEDWFGDRRGALVAIEPATGDILAFVSKPTFDPNLFIDGIDTQTWNALNTDPDTPLLNRPLRGTYPPGSTYKPFMALALLESGVRTANQTTYDPGYFMLGSHKFRDSNPRGNGSVDMRKSIVVSSDVYYYAAALDLGVDRIHAFMTPWGFGNLTGIDLVHESPGILPSSEWKMRRFKQKWFPGETPSIGIGQGYNSFTILQLAQATAILANDGVVMQPHLVKAIHDPMAGTKTLTVPTESYRIPLRPEHLQLVKSALVDVNRFGTGRHAFAGAPYVAAGKTGTAQVIGIKQGEKYDASRINERHRDHSLFMAFAPAEDPKIALAVIVENGGFGAQAAAPIARKVFDYHLLGKLPDNTKEPFGNRLDALSEADLRDVPEVIMTDADEPPLQPPAQPAQAPSQPQNRRR